MPVKIKARDQSGAVSETLCDDASKVIELVRDLQARGNTVWIEDSKGRVLDESAFP